MKYQYTPAERFSDLRFLYRRPALRHSLCVFCVFCGTFIFSPSRAQNIAINPTGTAANPSAMLDIDITSKGILVPRLSNAQRDAISSPAGGLLIYNTSSNQLNYWNGAAWVALSVTSVAAVNGAGTNTGPGIAINITGAAPHHSSILDVSSSTGGLLLPRMTTTERNAIAAPVAGLIIYNSTSNQINYYTGTSWSEFCGASVSAVTGATTNTAGIAINAIGAIPDASSILDINSTTSGLLIPRLTTAQRDAILSPALGLMLYNTSTSQINVYNGSGNWLVLSALTANGGANQSTSCSVTIGGAPTASGGTAPYTYSWSPASGLSSTIVANPSANPTTTTTYTVTITDAGGCIATASVTVTVVSCVSNTWCQKANFGGTARRNAIGFSISTKGYIGTGRDAVGRKQDFWEWDQVTSAWTQKANFGGTARDGAVGFSIGTKGYVGTGDDGARKQDFWEYDPGTNSWTVKSPFPGSARRDAVGFSIGAVGYVGTGEDGGGNKKDFWEYNPGSDTWTQKANFGGTAREQAVGFSIGTKGYIGTGDDNTGSGGFRNDFWEYDPGSDTWTQKADFGGIAREDAVGFSIGAMGYIGTGSKNASPYMNDFWEYDPNSDTWTQKANFGGTIRDQAAGFSIGTKGYIGTGDDGAYKQDFWEYCQ